MLGATPHQVYGEFDQGAREAAAKKGTGETAWAPTRCLLGTTTSLTNLVLTRTCWCPFRVVYNMSGLFILNLGGGLSLRACDVPYSMIVGCVLTAL